MNSGFVVPVLAANPTWTYWIGVPLAIGGVLYALVIVVGYLRKVQSPRYPRDTDV